MSSCLRTENQMKAGRTDIMKGSWDAAMAIWPGPDIWPDSTSHRLLQTVQVLWYLRSTTAAMCMAARNQFFH